MVAEQLAWLVIHLVDGQEEHLSRDVRVSQGLRNIIRLREYSLKLTRDTGLCATRNVGEIIDQLGCLSAQGRDICLDVLEQGCDNPMVLSEQDEEEMLRANLRIALLASERLCVCDGLAGFYGEAVVSHGAPRCGQRVRTLRARGAGVPQCMHQRTAVERNNQRMLFRAPVLCGTVALMIWALVLMLGCGEVLSDTPVVDAEAAVAVKGTLRSCLKVAGGLKKTEGGDVAAEYVHACYDKHFAPMKPVIRAQNSKAALSLEYGFGLLAHAMTDKRADTTMQAAQLADRVDAVLSTLAMPAKPEETTQSP